MLPILQIGPLSLQTPGLIILLGFWLGLLLAERTADSFGFSAARLYDLTFRAVIAAIVGARLAYILRFPQAFGRNPLNILSLNPGLLDPWGALAGILVIGWLYLRRHRLHPLKVLDAFTPALLVLACAIPLANLASGNGYGMPTTLPWGIELWGTRRHPSQIYELLAALGILALLWPGRHRAQAASRPDLPAGRYFLQFIVWSAGARLFLEAFRGDSQLLFGGFRLMQVVAWLLLAFSLWGISHLSHQQKAALEKKALP